VEFVSGPGELVKEIPTFLREARLDECSAEGKREERREERKEGGYGVGEGANRA